MRERSDRNELPKTSSAAFGVRLRVLRAHLQLNQTELARLCGRASTTSISRLEAGLANAIPFDLLAALVPRAAKVGVPLDWLITGRGEMLSPPHVERRPTPPTQKHSPAFLADVAEGSDRPPVKLEDYR